MIVEFVGLSAVGKSTLIRQVEERLRTSGVTVRSHDARSPGAGARASSRRTDLLRGAKRVPTVALIAVRTFRDRRGYSIRRYLRVVGYVSALNGSLSVHLVDEGPVKLLPTSPPFESWWPTLKASMPRPDLIVHVVCDTDVRLQRVRRLDRPHGRGVAESQLRQTEAYSLQRLHEAMNASGVPVLTVNPTEDPAAAVAIADEIALRHRAAE